MSGEVNQVLSPLAYSIGGERWANGDEILVIGPTQPVGDDAMVEDDPVREEDIVQVSGSIHDFDLQQIEQEIGAELEAEIPQELQDQPVLIVEGAVITTRVHPDRGEPVEIDDIRDDHNEYIDEFLTVEGDITEVIGEAAFVLEGEVLVVDSTDTMTQQALEEAESVEVSGLLIEFAVETASEAAGVELDEAEFEQYEGQPALIARSILLLPVREN